MKITVSGATAHLQGEWTLSGLTKVTIDSLAGALQQIKFEGIKTILIDCRQVTAIDSIGLMILDGLMYIPRLRGVGAELVSLPGKLRTNFLNSGLKINSTYNTLSSFQLTPHI
ncbi:MAG: STAS domain-containing protein [Geobacteraceae bacterium]|nr:STAS domain-containing protein [Geobacteraceae bacterium]NTW80408.1 STAS domain-containing protein [Geobacteraceae bacterium]